ncbi:MAG TPA: 6,7-dimethyl-8-ribityllumazine synthase [Candidatus Acidoferrales bacterium]|nr:6,7-dimethyl-8-ribityllumazine synthase [Candidatus Acidoferrales bacterium]
MIKSFHRLFVPSKSEDYRALVDFFSGLGFARGESWEGHRSTGVKLETPEAGVEIGIGEGFPNADLVIEVDSADVVYELVQKRGDKVLDEIVDCDWGARMFVVEMPQNAGRLAIFSYTSNWRQPSLEGQLDGHGLRVAIVVSRFNAFITERLLAGAIDALHRTGVADSGLQVVRVPGAYEIPSAARMLAETKNFDAVVCIGCLLRGDTLHYEVIANEVTRGVGQATQETGVPMGFAVLTCDTLEQAIDRAGLKAGNKGFEAALAAIEMAQLKRQTKAK